MSYHRTKLTAHRRLGPPRDWLADTLGILLSLLILILILILIP